MSVHALQGIERNLDKVGEDTWDCDDFDVFDSMVQRLSRLEAQLHVQRSLQWTAKLLREQSRDKALPNQQATRVKHFIRFTFEKITRGTDRSLASGNSGNPAGDDGDTTQKTLRERQTRLRKLECNAVKFCGLTYKIKDLLELPAAQFDFLVANVGDFVLRHKLSQHLYRDDIDKAVHGKFDPEDDVIFKEFLKSHVELRPSKRKRDEVSDGQSVEPDREQRSSKAAEDGIEKAPSPTPPTKRRHIEDERAPEATAIGDVQTGGTETQQSETPQMGRQIQYMFSKGPTSHIPLLGNLLSDAVQASNQWKMEQRLGESTTECLTTLIPEGQGEDISITLWVGQIAGFRMLDLFKLQPTWSALPKHL